MYTELGRYRAEVKTVAGNRVAGSADGPGPQARFRYPMDVALDKTQENVLVVDRHNHTLRLFTDAEVSTLAGCCGEVGCADGPGLEARFNQPSGVVGLRDGNWAISDCNNHRIVIVSPDGEVSLLAGGGADGGAMGTEDGLGAAARFHCPHGLAELPGGDLVVADRMNHRIRRVTREGVVTTIAGSSAGHNDGSGTEAQFECPQGIAMHPNGRLIVADSYTHCIRSVSIDDGSVETIAGESRPSKHRDGVGRSARFSGVSGVTCLSDGTIIACDNDTATIRMITPDKEVSTLCGEPDTFGFGRGLGRDVRLSHPMAITKFSDTRMLFVDVHNHELCEMHLIPKNDDDDDDTPNALE